MKHRNLLNLTEYLLLIGSGIGSVASIASQQVIFTAAPISALFLLNLMNHRRLEAASRENITACVTEVDQKFTSDIVSLQKQVQALPNFLDLASLRKAALNANEEALSHLAQEIAQLKQDIEKPDWQVMQRSLRQLQQQYEDLTGSVAGVASQLNRLTIPNKVESLEQTIALLKTELSQLRVSLDNLSVEQKQNNTRLLQDQINHLNRRLNQLPTPFDASALKQDINSLVKAMSDMASRRELSRLASYVEKLTQQHQSLEQTVTPIKIATTILRKQLDMLATLLPTPETLAPPGDNADPQLLDTLKQTVTALEQRINQLPDTGDLSNLRSEVQGMVSAHLGQLQQQLITVQQFTQTLEQQQQHLHNWVQHLPQILDSTAIQNQVKSLAARVEQAEDHGELLKSQMKAAIDAHLEELAEQLDPPNRDQYELVFDVKAASQSHSLVSNGASSPAMVEQALASAEARLILVFPYPTPELLSHERIQKFRAFLDRQGCLDIGWGHLGDTSGQHIPRSLDHQRSIDRGRKGFLHEILNQLTQLKRQYPDRFRFKVLGTDENFLVCDRSYAILGVQSIATASNVFPQAAVGLRTTDAGVIQELVDRFDNPLLDIDNATAYFNRALTRYDLGDQAGALADYTEVLRIHPTDDVAYNNRALIHYNLGDRRSAIADFERAIHYNVDNFIAYCNRGIVRAELGDKLGAIEDYTYAIQINPDYVTAYFYRGITRTRLQNKIGAIQDYTEVIRLHPQDATAYFYRGLACIKLGQRADAIQDLQRAAQLFAQQGDRASYQQVIGALKKLQETMMIASSSQHS